MEPQPDGRCRRFRPGGVAALGLALPVGSGKMDPTRVKMVLGLALFACGLWRVLGGPGTSPLGFVPGAAGVAVGVAAAVGGFWLYKASCPT
jgi:hypothetical protein